MKKKLITFLIIAAMGIIGLISCADAGGDGGASVDSKDAIVASGNQVTLISDGTCDEEVMDGLYVLLDDITSGKVDYGNASDNAKKGDIVIGETSRAVSKAAKDKLNNSIRREIKASPDEDAATGDLAGYVIYFDGTSVAITWSNDYLAPVAVEYFMENYLSGDALTLEAGYVKTEVVSITAYLKERGEKIKDEAWAEFAAQLPEEYSEDIVNSMRSLYELYSSDVAIWMANLYDPETGAFYRSNSARDNYGFLPDLESTGGVIGFMQGSGMAEMYGNNGYAAVPDWMAEKMCAWVLSLYDEDDDFFYHPQWPKEYLETNKRTARLTRDRSSAIGILRGFGVMGKDDPVPVTSSVYMTSRLGTSTAAAVSKVVPASDLTSQYSSLESFKAYIAGQRSQADKLTGEAFASKFYSLGNDFQSALLNGFLTQDMKKVLIEFFDDYQNKETGMWADGYYWTATNGVHKIADCYNMCGAQLKYTDKIVNSVLRILTTSPDKLPVSSTPEVYNALSCFGYIYKNVGATSDTAKAYKNLVYENATLIIQNAITHTATFSYSDGSFGGRPTTQGEDGQSQGCPAGVAGAKEGGVNATSLASIDVVTHTFAALGLSDYQVPIFTEYERYLLMSTIESLGTVEKGGVVLSEEIVFDFEDAKNEDDIPVDIKMNKIDSEVYIEETEDGNNRLVVKSQSWYEIEGNNTKKRNANFTIYAGTVDEDANVGVLEFDIAFDNVNTWRTDTQLRLDLQDSVNNSIAAYGFSYYKGTNSDADKKQGMEPGYYYVKFSEIGVSEDGKTTTYKDLKINFPAGTDGFKFRIEYYKEEQFCKIYVVHEDEVYYVAKCNGIITPGATLNGVLFQFLGHASGTVYLDNIVVQNEHVKNEPGEPTTPPTLQLPVRGRPDAYDFEDVSVGKNYPKYFDVTENTGKVRVERLDNDNYVRVTGTSEALKANPEFGIYSYEVDKDANAYVLTADIKIDQNAVNANTYANALRLRLLDTSDEEVVVFRIRAVNDGDSTKLIIVDDSDWDTVLAEFDFGEEINIRIEYFCSNNVIGFYVNGELARAYFNELSGAEVTKASFKVEARSGIDMTLDNFGLTHSKLEAEPENPEEIEKPETPDTPVTPGEPEEIEPTVPREDGTPTVPDSDDTDNSDSEGWRPVESEKVEVKPGSGESGGTDVPDGGGNEGENPVPGIPDDGGNGGTSSDMTDDWLPL